MVYTGRGASISPAMPLPLGRVSDAHCQKYVSEDSAEMLFVTYSLLTWLPHTSIGFKKRSDVQRLTAPDVTMNGPIQSELEASAV